LKVTVVGCELCLGVGQSLLHVAQAQWWLVVIEVVHLAEDCMMQPNSAAICINPKFNPKFDGADSSYMMAHVHSLLSLNTYQESICKRGLNGNHWGVASWPMAATVNNKG
jgi:hypothetical protein